MTAVWHSLLLAGLVIGAAVAWRRGSGVVKQVFAAGSVRTCIALGIIGAAYAILSSLDQLVIYVLPVATGMLILAVVFEAKDRRRSHAAKAAAAR
jgi:hypothetical protein